MDLSPFHFSVFGLGAVGYIEREKAVETALDIIAVAALFGGLSEPQRARLARIVAAADHSDSVAAA